MDLSKVKADSEYKYLHGTSFRDKFTDLKVPNTTESKYVQCNGFFTAMPWKAGGGGQIAVMKVDDYARFTVNDPMIKGHSGSITDFQFSPFYDNILCTASEDGKIGIWSIPLDGLVEDLKVPNIFLKGHTKKIIHSWFNPTSENLLASNSYDKTIRLWDVYTGQEQAKISGLIGYPIDMSWNADGSLIAISDNGKKMHILDPRDDSTSISGEAVHDGPKKIKLCWLSDSNRIVTSGMSKQMLREICIWDSRDISEPLVRKKIDKTIEVSDPFYDEATKLLFFAAKSDWRVNIWELTDDSEMIYPVASYKGETAQRGFNFWPKQFIHEEASEIMRGVRLTDKTCEYVSFRLPNPMKLDYLPPHENQIRLFEGTFDDGSGEVVTVKKPTLSSASPSGPSAQEIEELKQSYQTKFDDLQAELDQSKSKVAGLESTIENLTNENTSLKETIEQLKMELQASRQEPQPQSQPQPDEDVDEDVKDNNEGDVDYIPLASSTQDEPQPTSTQDLLNEMENEG